MTSKPHSAGSVADSDSLELVCASASLRTGALLDHGGAPAARERLEGLAATLPDLFGTLDPSCLDRLSGRFGAEEQADTFSEILFLSDKHLHVIQPIPRRPGVALLAVCPAPGSIGLVLSTLRARAAALGEE